MDAVRRTSQETRGCCSKAGWREGNGLSEGIVWSVVMMLSRTTVARPGGAVDLTGDDGEGVTASPRVPRSTSIRRASKWRNRTPSRLYRGRHGYRTGLVGVCRLPKWRQGTQNTSAEGRDTLTRRIVVWPTGRLCNCDQDDTAFVMMAARRNRYGYGGATLRRGATRMSELSSYNG